MTTAQTKLYFREWSAARKKLRAAGFSPQDADAERAKIHQDNDLPKSSKAFNTTTDLDKFIKACRQIAGTSHIDITDQERKRLIHLIEKTGFADEYLDKLTLDKSEAFNWRTMKADKLKHLLYTATNRARAKKQIPDPAPF